ncbi:MAG: NAD(P)H-hydrate epimerase, partial [Leptolyngbya sp. SIO1D8]|nr:NAD(P)H-hydrate epimerase [Leptolyngbya sp. SIO1D8]
MQQLEASLFAAGMPVPALMEKVAGRIARWIATHYPRDRAPTVGFIVGPGHNGGDALVVARELYHHGYQVRVWCPFVDLKALTAHHQTYLKYLNVSCTDTEVDLQCCDLIVDGGFGIGLTRSLTGQFAQGIEAINRWHIPVVSIDLPTGLETNTGKVLGTAIRAHHTLCLGLWKLGLMQDVALPWLGQVHLIPFDLPSHSIQSAIANLPSVRRISTKIGYSHLPLNRSAIAHKYMVGHLLLIAGSRQYAGAALLAGKGAIASGVGMMTLIVPESLRLTAISQLPE